MCPEINSFPRITALKNCAGVSLAQFLCLVLTKNNQISGCEAVFEVQIFSKGKVETRRKPDGFQGMRQSISDNLPSKTNTSLRKGPQSTFFNVECGMWNGEWRMENGEWKMENSFFTVWKEKSFREKPSSEKPKRRGHGERIFPILPCSTSTSRGKAKQRFLFLRLFFLFRKRKRKNGPAGGSETKKVSVV